MFDIEKLNWLNGVYLRQLEIDDLIENGFRCVAKGDVLGIKSDVNNQSLLF